MYKGFCKIAVRSHPVAALGNHTGLPLRLPLYVSRASRPRVTRASCPQWVAPIKSS